MDDNNNLFANSQLLNIGSEQKKIVDTLYRCSEAELLLVLYAKIAERGIDATDVKQYLQYSDSAASCILRRLSDTKYNKRLITALMEREKSGARGAWLYFVKQDVELHYIKKVQQQRGYDYQAFIERQTSRNAKQYEVVYQNKNEQFSTNVLPETGKLTSEEEELQGQAKEVIAVNSDNIDNKELHLPGSADFNENKFPFLIQILQASLAEKDKQLQEKEQQIYQMQDEYKRLINLVLKQ